MRDNTITEYLFSLIRLASGFDNSSIDISHINLLELFNLAENQTVDGLAYDALNQLDLKMTVDNEDVLLDWFSFAEQIKSQNVQTNREIADSVKLLEKENISYLIVKGQTLASIYHQPRLRVSGDVDILIRDNYTSIRDSLSESLKVVLPHKMIEKEVGFERNDIHYDLHSQLISFASKGHQQYWESIEREEWNQRYCVEIEGQPVRTLTPTVNAVYIFLHLFFHFIREGVGLRQFCDWAMVLHHYRDEINRDKLQEILKQLDMVKAYKAFGTVIVGELGLPAEEFPFEITEKDRRWKSKILTDVFKGGNFGKENHKAHRKYAFKLETLIVSLRNTFRYFTLCPTEVGLLIPRLIKGNLKIMMEKG